MLEHVHLLLSHGSDLLFRFEQPFPLSGDVTALIFYFWLYFWLVLSL